MSSKVQENTIVKIDPRIDVKLPKEYKVIFLDDDVTSMGFVVAVLMEFFNHTEERATELTKEIHESGAAVVGVYSFEIAEHKGVQVTTAARLNNFPLKVKVEPNE